MRHLKQITILFVLATVLLTCKTEPPKKPIEVKTETKTEAQTSDTLNYKNTNLLIKRAIRKSFEKQMRVKMKDLTKDLMLIKQKSFFSIAIKDSINSYKNILRKEQHSNAFSLYGEKNNKLAIIYRDDKKEDLIGAIEILSKEPKTESGISVGMSFGDLLRIHPNTKINDSVTKSKTIAKHGNLSFILDFTTNNNNDSKIKSISIN